MRSGAAARHVAPWLVGRNFGLLLNIGQELCHFLGWPLHVEGMAGCANDLQGMDRGR